MFVCFFTFFVYNGSTDPFNLVVRVYMFPGFIYSDDIIFVSISFLFRCRYIPLNCVINILNILKLFPQFIILYQPRDRFTA